MKELLAHPERDDIKNLEMLRFNSSLTRELE
jgi:hypothetical protein